MTKFTFCKLLTANDVGATGAHQGGMHVPKTMPELLSFLPDLNAGSLNPSAWITCLDEYDEIWKFRYIYYNNKFHSLNGYRNEFRITHTTKYFKRNLALEGDSFIITKALDEKHYRIRLAPQTSTSTDVVKLAGWREIH